MRSHPGSLAPLPAETWIPHSRPTAPSAEEWAEVTGRLAPGWVADGPCVAEFARRAAAVLGCDGGAAVNSGTSALHLALAALGAGPGREVLVPAYCCAALLNAVRLAGADPVLVDCEPGGFNMCPEDAARRVTRRTASIVVAHMFGCPAPMTPFLRLGPPVIEDCAQSLGAREGDAPTGSRGAAAVGSFYATKVITTGHGGLTASSRPDVLAAAADLVDYDNREDWKPRFNYRMGELAAALGLWQLDRLPALLDRRRAIAAYYDAAIGDACGPALGRRSDGIPYRYVIRTREADSLIRRLHESGIESKRPVYRPLHHYLEGVFPHAEEAHKRLVSLPLYPALTDIQVEDVVRAVRAAAA